MGDEGAVALAPAIGQLKKLTTLQITGKIPNIPSAVQGECPLLLPHIPPFLYTKPGFVSYGTHTHVFANQTSLRSYHR